MPKDLSKFEGTVVPNDQVAGFCAKHGAPAFSKPHGAGKTVLYYPNPDAGKSEAEQQEDFAGRETPATRTMVVQGNPEGSVIASRVIRAGAKPNAVAFDDNPNRAVADAPILNEEAAQGDTGKTAKKRTTKKAARKTSKRGKSR